MHPGAFFFFSKIMSSSSSEAHAQSTIVNLLLRVGDQTYYAPFFETQQSGGILVDLPSTTMPAAIDTPDSRPFIRNLGNKACTVGDLLLRVGGEIYYMPVYDAPLPGRIISEFPAVIFSNLVDNPQILNPPQPNDPIVIDDDESEAQIGHVAESDDDPFVLSPEERSVVRYHRDMEKDTFDRIMKRCMEKNEGGRSIGLPSEFRSLLRFCKPDASGRLVEPPGIDPWVSNLVCSLHVNLCR